MSASAITLSVLILLTVGLIGWTLRRPALSQSLGGKILAFVAFCILPAIVVLGGLTHHFEQAKTTEFCLSCHIMEPYGRSLWVDHGRFIPAVHFQNKQIPRNRACFSCHTTYTMFGDFEAKLRGAKHVWHNVWGTASDPIELYEPYNNRECFYCHEGARSYEEHAEHVGYKQDLRADRKSCLMCHNLVHEVGKLNRYDMWRGEPTQ